MMKCSIIQDLLPLYVDGVVSEDTAQAVEEHLETCEACRKTAEQMKQGLELPSNPDLNQESVQALKLVKQTLRWKWIAVAAISALLTLVLVVSGYLVFENVGVVHDFFDPIQRIRLRDNQTQEWQTMHFLEGFSDAETTDNFHFDNLFYSRKVINTVDSEGPVTLRFRDLDGNVVLDELELQPGTSASLKGLRLFTDYQIEIKTDADFVALNFV